ncbi:hypothetical protein [Sporocytophaga myxococcoides]|uniref:hypothetical protein n=1 Tax=Sporocytophaga myxococcoides TaxID=153721 RepID=UPI000426EC2C|nr:hypothetical protein [Sporocytophaga myxococcoides]
MIKERIYPNYLWIIISLITSIFFCCLTIACIVLFILSIKYLEFKFILFSLFCIPFFGYIAYLNLYTNVNYISFIKIEQDDELIITHPLKYQKLRIPKRQIKEFAHDSISIGKVGSTKTIILHMTHGDSIEFAKIYHWNFSSLNEFLKRNKVKYNKDIGGHWTLWRRNY